MPEECPRCGGVVFTAHESGPDSFEDDVTWTSYACQSCGLWFSEWTDKWYVDAESWQDEEAGNEYMATEN